LASSSIHPSREPELFGIGTGEDAFRRKIKKDLATFFSLESGKLEAVFKNEASGPTSICKYKVFV
jgi:hypothetical protein